MSEDLSPVLGSASGDLQAVIDVAQEAARPTEIDTETPQAIVVPAWATLQIPDVEEYRETPRRRRGVYKPATVDSFIAYVQRFYAEAFTTVWVHPTSGAITAILDDHGPEDAGWRAHRVELRLAFTPEWLYWTTNNGQMLSQDAFAEHIESGLPEIVEPDAIAMLEIAQSFHATTSAQFRQSLRLASGEQQLQYDEEIQATAGRSGEMTVPTEMTLAIAPFVGEDPYKVVARLRFRVAGGKLTLSYRLDRPKAIVRDALTKISEKIGEPFVQTYIGDPPS